MVIQGIVVLHILILDLAIALPGAEATTSVALRWNSATLQGIRDAKLGAPVVARALAIVHTCMYDAWAAYDERAVGTQLGGALRRPPSERTSANKEQAALICAMICLPSTAQDETVDVPLTDATPGGSPLEVRGRALIHEVTEGPEIESSWGANVVVKNISDKAITLVFATLTELGRHPASGPRGGLDDGPTYIIAEDRFFETDIEPSDSVVLRNTKPGSLGRSCCVNSIDKVRSPEAEFKVLFVQYADGSIFGDPAAATKVFAGRKAIIAVLRRLVEPLAGDGEERFGDKLNRECASLGFCAPIFRALERSGERAALTEVRRLLSNAEKHAELLTPYSAN